MRNEFLQMYRPRCSWIQRMVDKELYERERENWVGMSLGGIMNLRHDAMSKGYDPYNSADTTPRWLKVLPPEKVITKIVGYRR